MQKKIDALRSLMDKDDWRAAIKLAARFPRLGEQDKPIRRAASAMLSPGLYRGMGMDPEAVIDAGRVALIARYRP